MDRVVRIFTGLNPPAWKRPAAGEGQARPVIPLDDIPAIAAFVLARAQMRADR